MRQYFFNLIQSRDLFKFILLCWSINIPDPIGFILKRIDDILGTQQSSNYALFVGSFSDTEMCILHNILIKIALACPLDIAMSYRE